MEKRTLYFYLPIDNLNSIPLFLDFINQNALLHRILRIVETILS